MSKLTTPLLQTQKKVLNGFCVNAVKVVQRQSLILYLPRFFRPPPSLYIKCMVWYGVCIPKFPRLSMDFFFGGITLTSLLPRCD